MNWYTYSCTAIDYNWDCLPTVAQTARHLGGHAAALSTGHSQSIPPSTENLDRFLDAWKDAKIAAANAGWNGDFMGEPVVIWLPNENFAKFVYAFAFKQNNNNGQTFVMSPLELTWLDSSLIKPLRRASGALMDEDSPC